MNIFDENTEMSVPIVLSEGNNGCQRPELKKAMQMAIERFHVKIEQLPDLLGISMEQVENILQDNPCLLEPEEDFRVVRRLIYLSEGITGTDEIERARAIVNTVLVDHYHFSHESLAIYANVPYEFLKSFCENNTQIESKYLIKICVNLFMLYFTLNT